jgi:hypothetical protein
MKNDKKEKPATPHEAVTNEPDRSKPRVREIAAASLRVRVVPEPKQEPSKPRVREIATASPRVRVVAEPKHEPSKPRVREITTAGPRVRQSDTAGPRIRVVAEPKHEPSKPRVRQKDTAGPRIRVVAEPKHEPSKPRVREIAIAGPRVRQSDTAGPRVRVVAEPKHEPSKPRVRQKDTAGPRVRQNDSAVRSVKPDAKRPKRVNPCITSIPKTYATSKPIPCITKVPNTKAPEKCPPPKASVCINARSKPYNFKIITDQAVVFKVNTVKDTCGRHQIEYDDLVEFVYYQPTKTQYSDFPKGGKYMMAMISGKNGRNPQTLIFIKLNDKSRAWEKFLVSNSYKVMGKSTDSVPLEENSTGRLTIQQNEDNGPIDITFDIVNKQSKWTCFSILIPATKSPD